MFFNILELSYHDRSGRRVNARWCLRQALPVKAQALGSFVFCASFDQCKPVTSIEAFIERKVAKSRQTNRVVVGPTGAFKCCFHKCAANSLSHVGPLHGHLVNPKDNRIPQKQIADDRKRARLLVRCGNDQNFPFFKLSVIGFRQFLG